MGTWIKGDWTGRGRPSVSVCTSSTGFLSLIPFCSARDTLFSAVYPLIKFIGNYAGCYVTLLAAAPEKAGNKPYFSASVGSLVHSSALLTPDYSLHYFPDDKVKRVNWTQYNKQDFKDRVTGPFFKYIHWMGM